MATTPPEKGKAKGKASKRRVYLAIGLVAVVVIGYLWYRSRGASGAAVSAGAAPSQAGLPSTGSSDQGGSGGEDISGILAALAGENQDLLRSFLGSEQGLLSLAGSSVGAPSSTTGSSGAATSGFATPTAPSGGGGGGGGGSGGSGPQVGPGPNDLFAAPAISAPAGSGLAQIQAEEGYGSAPVATNAQVQAAAQAGQSYLQSIAPNLDLGYSPIDLPDNVSGSGPTTSIDLPDSVSGSGPYTPPPAPPTYGITYGAPAGQRASSTPKQGTISVH